MPKSSTKKGSFPEENEPFSIMELLKISFFSLYHLEWNKSAKAINELS